MAQTVRRCQYISVGWTQGSCYRPSALMPPSQEAAAGSCSKLLQGDSIKANRCSGAVAPICSRNRQLNGLMLMTLTAVGTSTRRRLPGSTLVTTFLQPASSARLTGLHPQAPPTGGPMGPWVRPWVDWAGWFSVLGGSLFPLQTSVMQHSWKRLCR